MKWLATFVSIFFFAQTVFGNAAIFSGADVKILKPNLNMNGQGKIMSGTVDPTATATSAAVGTVYLNTSNGNLYKKLDAGSSTNWEQIRQDNKNQLKNPSASTGVDSWTNGGGTFVRTTTSGEFKSAPAGFSWTASGGGEVITSNSWSIPTNGTVNAVGYCYFAGTASNYDLELYTNGSTIERAVDIPASTTFQKVEISFVAQSGSSYQIRARSYSGGTEINWDDCYLGENAGLTNVSQASLFGTAIQEGAAGATCLFPESTSTGTTDFVTLGTGTGCNAWATTGSIGVTGTNSSSITIAQMPPGEYLFEVTGGFQTDTAARFCLFRLTDGTTALSDVSTINNSLAYETHLPKVTGNFSVTTALTSKTFSIQAADDGAGVCRLYNGTAGTRLTWKVWKYPTSSEIAAKNDATLQEWTSFTPTGSWSGTTTYTGKYRQVGDSLEVEAKVALSGGPTGTNLDFTIPFSLSIDTAKLTEASGNNINLGTFNAYLGSASTFNGTVAYQSTTSVRLYYQTTGGSPSNSITNTALTASAPGSFASGGQVIARFKVPIVGWTSKVPVPVYQGSVTSNSAGAERVERLYVTNSGTPTISTQSGSWVSSLTDLGVGQTTINIASGIFSAAPTCTVSQEGGGGTAYCYVSSGGSATAQYVICYDTSVSLADRNFKFICMGPR